MGYLVRVSSYPDNCTLGFSSSVLFTERKSYVFYFYFPEERRLAEDEKPLFVQLNWGKDVREGRFLLRNEDHPTVRVRDLFHLVEVTINTLCFPFSLTKSMLV